MSSLKRRKSLAPASAIVLAPRPLTRSCISATQSASEAVEQVKVDAVLDSLMFVESGEFEDAEHIPLLYRLRPNSLGRTLLPVKEKDDPSNAQSGNDSVADALGFPSPFLVVNMGDRKGIWQSSPPLVKELGEDPQKQRRGVVPLSGTGRMAVAPAGLKNLGATCYLNSLLQYLFFNVDFRQGLLEAPSSSNVVLALQQMFVLLSRGQRSVVDTTAFVSAAGLEAGEQEDATEFNTLLLDWLERELDHGKDDAKGGGFIPALFQGEVSQILSCLEHPDHAFVQREPFYELRARLTPTSGTTVTAASSQTGTARTTVGSGLRAAPLAPPVGTVVGAAAAEESVEAGATLAMAVSKNRPAGPGSKRSGGGKKKATAPSPVVYLEQLLADTAFPDEMLDGANQYHCPKCDQKVDARKSMRLAKPPPYLHVTVERYHYDLKKGEREKLNNPVSFPQQLQLRLCAGLGMPKAAAAVAAAPVVSYECVGYLEHVSDSAHSGHYTATLYQQEEDAVEALALAAEEELRSSGEGTGQQACATSTSEGGAGPPGPPAKRLRCSSADVATDVPRHGVWWTLDDTQASPVIWPQVKPSADGAPGLMDDSVPLGPCNPPKRIESSSAYLILYRRSDCSRRHIAGGGSCVPAEHAEYAASMNSAFAVEQQEFARRSKAVAAFLSERRQAATALARALREAPSGSGRGKAQFGHEAMSIVPTAWLQALLRGEDRCVDDLLEGEMQLLAPVLYRRALLRAPGGCGQVLDPLAVWTGEVKFVPTAALSSLGGIGGIDPSLFLPADERSLGRDACEKMWHLAKLFAQEWAQIGKILHECKVSAADARALHAAGRGEEIVWVATRVQKLWQRAVSGAGAISGGKGQPWQVMAMRAFLAEAHAARWAGQAGAVDESETQAEAAQVASAADTASPAADTLLGPRPAAPSLLWAADHCEVNLTAGLLCAHGLVCRPKAGVLYKRSEVIRLLEISGAKERAYKALWPDARAVPRARTGLPSGDLLSFGATCPECHGDGGDRTALEAQPAVALRKLVVRRLYPSGVKRKTGTVTIPEGEEPITGASIRGIVQDQLSLPVAKLLVVKCTGPEAAKAEVELQDDQALSDGAEHVIVEKDEAAQPALEAAAFEGSVFRARRGVPRAARG